MTQRLMKTALIGALALLSQGALAQAADKHAVMRTPEGRVFTKEMLIRRLEFFNEAARQVNVMRTQQALGSPRQY